MRTRVVKIADVEAVESAFADAGRIIRNGGLVVFPTETVYGLGADATNAEAVEGIYRCKGRPSDNPLIVHVASVEQAETIARVSPETKKLMQRFWPGPLTLVLPVLQGVPSIVTAGLSTVAVRMPDHEVALRLIRAADTPVAAPSANRSTRPSPTDAQAVLEDMDGLVAMVLDAGPTAVGVESTVVDATGPCLALLRPGGVPVETIEEFRGAPVAKDSCALENRSPGTRRRHYAPSIPVVLMDPGELWKNEPAILEAGDMLAYMGMADPPGPVCRAVVFQSVGEYGRGLFQTLRLFERCGAKAVLAELPGDPGLGRAIADRLRRASEKRR
ncbi:MAG: L-threonylcarbamoyladenylate synthase [Synergistota bacterium]|nr:L-threonylcarbamoyladenylate synthase [Synergistota bacterium]